MSTDFEKLITSLRDDSLRDYEVVKLLNEQSGSWSRRQRVAVCFAVLTAESSPPRMGALSAARKLVADDPGAEREMWAKLSESVNTLTFPQLVNWICAHYGMPFDHERFANFELLTRQLRTSHARLLVGMMFLTWKSGGDDVERVKSFVSGLLARESGRIDQEEEKQLASRLAELLETMGAGTEGSPRSSGNAWSNP